jgi:N-methylhydantoinase A/oxoprolinase/acetone carboxylase beta subunit
MIGDPGGTTTDIGEITQAKPGIRESDAAIGGWQTRIPSAKIWTLGLGGDSKITIDSPDTVRIGPRRVEPLSFAASKHEELKTKLGGLNGTDDVGMENQGLEFYTLLKMPAFPGDRHERRVLDALRGGCRPAFRGEW